MLPVAVKTCTRHFLTGITTSLWLLSVAQSFATDCFHRHRSGRPIHSLSPESFTVCITVFSPKTTTLPKCYLKMCKRTACQWHCSPMLHYIFFIFFLLLFRTCCIVAPFFWTIFVFAHKHILSSLFKTSFSARRFTVQVLCVSYDDYFYSFIFNSLQFF